ncbi:alpha-keto acid decarboxylase family protein [Streptomyces sp. AV19]|uniref:alpha-keto acid decarboxylase family protein n=1 Tax=Streptomyces sp. AV19 TaxID=2793068 RepID=UPI0018FEC7BD|nr:thiamine pyrophosphate-binding protein [Streptomyces sp. AV19]MBH1937946.1 alpha-keto acid decarboxylase family protein [Streptomyces sp. AV19]MDG4536885.1 thiamine pyrophosphate-binding protein [Streptomyces sp. AV19]
MALVPLGDYLLDRLRELGIGHIFGVPGDYNLGFLDRILDHPDLEWVGNCNELNAAYAADGYARRRGAAALATTFGVGELSAVNGIAGSFAEQVPVLAITGMPASTAAASGAPLHHTLADGNYDHFGRMFQEVTAARETLTARAPTEQIDRLLRTMLSEKRPVHLNFPADLVALAVPAPEAPLLEAGEHSPDRPGLGAFLEHAARLLADSGSATVLAGHQIDRYGLAGAVRVLLESAPIRACVLSSARGTVAEDAPYFTGVYVGAFSDKATRAAVEDTDLLVLAGAQITDTVTGGFTHDFPVRRTIGLFDGYATVGHARYEGVTLGNALAGLTALFSGATDLRPLDGTATPDRRPEPAKGPLTQQSLWARVEAFLQPGEVLVAEQGTSFFAAQEITLPPDGSLIGQPLWGSIGYTLPATLGAQLAVPENRCVLVIGDGSLQLTAQALGTMARYGAAPVVIVVNNDGYTVERAIHGPTASYNDIGAWDYTALPTAFGAAHRSLAVRAQNGEELDAALAEARSNPDKLVLIEAVLDQDDSPELLTAICRRFAEQNNYGG